MQQAPYTTEARQIVFNADIQLTATFKGGAVYKGNLGGIRQWAIDNNVDSPLSCVTEQGRHGLYPCLVATNEKIAAGLSVMAGCQIEVGNGSTFATRQQMRGHARALALAGIKLDYASFQWGITELPYANSPKAIKAKLTSDEQIELQLADSPF